MKRTTIWTIILCIPLTLGCQRLFTEDVEVDTQFAPAPAEAPTEAEFIVAGDGSSYSIKCLRGVASRIEAEGRGAADGCKMGNVATRGITRNVQQGRGYWGDYDWYGGYWNYWYLYPPTYYGGGVGNNNFCNTIFGWNFGSGFNCYTDFFGFDDTIDYPYGQYDELCYECLTRPNPRRCSERRRNNGRCWSYGDWGWYY